MRVTGTNGVSDGGNNDYREASKFAAECRTNSNAPEDLAKNNPQRAAELLRNTDLMTIALGFWQRLKKAVEAQQQ